MTDKKSFLLYGDQEEIICELSDEQAGKLFKAIYKYENTGDIIKLDPITNIAMIGIRQALDRNREKYQKISGLRANAGAKGGLAKANKIKQNSTKASKSSKCYDNDNVNDNVNDISKETTKRKVKKPDEYSEDYKTFLSFYPERSGADSEIAGWRQWKIRLAEGDTELEMIAGAKAYQIFSNATGKTNTPYVMTKAKFLGRDKHFKYLSKYEVKHGESTSDKIDRGERILAQQEACGLDEENIFDL